MRFHVFRATLLVLSLAASGALAQHGHGAAAPPEPAAPSTPTQADAPPLYDTLGSYHFAITTYRDDAQEYFDQGLRWMHAFNLEEAEAAFRAAAGRDPSCAMCRWGVAFSLGPHINLPAIPERTAAAATEIEQARRLAGASPRAATRLERALIDAMVHRYSNPAPATPEEQKALDVAYAVAMRAVARTYHEEAEVQFLLAESLMDLHPWDLWTSDGQPKEWTPEIIAAIERGLALDPKHPGLHHLHIHAVEAGPDPDRALASADYLRQAMPGAAHMVHMPGHIYMRVGRYADAATQNERAAAVDGSYLAQASPNVSFYRMLYEPHNIDFLAAAAQMEGRSAAALLAARAVEHHLTPEALAQMPGFDFLLNRSLWTLLHFGRYTEVLAAPLPPESFPYATAMAHAARGIALVQSDRLDDAEAALAAVDRSLAAVPEGATQGLNQARALGAIGRDLLAGLLLTARGADRSSSDEGVARLLAAAAAEDQIVYNEPSDWYFPARHVVGPALLRLGRVTEAERVFRADLAENRDNGWSLAGLAVALERQGKAAEAAATRAKLAVAWARADLGLERLMAPAARPR
jgi:tetratricopeptide (TPR) repeat protein